MDRGTCDFSESQNRTRENVGNDVPPGTCQDNTSSISQHKSLTLSSFSYQKKCYFCFRANGVGSISESGRSLGGGHGNSLQYFCLENPMDRGSWWTTVHGVAPNWTRLKQLSIHTSSLFLTREAYFCFRVNGIELNLQRDVQTLSWPSGGTQCMDSEPMPWL